LVIPVEIDVSSASRPSKMNIDSHHF
jgi:hypothetical protein